MWLRARIVALPGRIYQRLVGDIEDAGSATEARAAEPGSLPAAEPGSTRWLLLGLSAPPRPSPEAPLPAVSAEEVRAGEATGDCRRQPPAAVSHGAGQGARARWSEPRVPRA